MWCGWWGVATLVAHLQQHREPAAVAGDEGLVPLPPRGARRGMATRAIDGGNKAAPAQHCRGLRDTVGATLPKIESADTICFNPKLGCFPSLFCSGVRIGLRSRAGPQRRRQRRSLRESLLAFFARLHQSLPPRYTTTTSTCAGHTHTHTHPWYHPEPLVGVVRCLQRERHLGLVALVHV